MSPPLPPALDISPPLVNSANPWATTLDDLRLLHACPSTGAVTTRTSLIQGFAHDPSKHQYIFHSPETHASSARDQPIGTAPPAQTASLNSLGYSPHTLEIYLHFIKTISNETVAKHSSPAGPPSSSAKKPFIVSVTGTPAEVAQSYDLIAAAAREVAFPLAMEINLSCPNIPDKPPPAYSRTAVAEYLAAVQARIAAAGPGLARIPFGLKTPPYTYPKQFDELFGALEVAAEADPAGACPVSFITATNTLGSCLVFSSPSPSTSSPAAAGVSGELGASDALSLALPGMGIGGMAGAPLHPLALGNVATLTRMLGQRGDKMGHVCVVGVGGVLDTAGYRRMRAVGAKVVGIGTALGLKGIKVFEDIESEVEGRW
ncbi:hypothetical protein B0T22DRAFT_228820 [Podospora appendiculata]|uniref:Dihydroorotate dehydrogenase (fumarate) n=1 Tax=Podospora appendiculata TaxID=314037 RepID=A0AAE1CAQ4_9PEZI|nr:hypothetical protein B0T22DRAFT_228820 [Podospora appendiculata]